jgi:hypothetical protein
MGVEREAVGFVDLLCQAGERAVGDVDHGVAPVADEVSVPGVAQVVERGAVTGMDVLDDADVAEALQHPVHRRRRDPGLSTPDRFDQIVCGEVAVGLDEDLYDEARRCGDSTSSVSDDLEDLLVKRGERAGRPHDSTLTDDLTPGRAPHPLTSQLKCVWGRSWGSPSTSMSTFSL